MRKPRCRRLIRGPGSAIGLPSGRQFGGLMRLGFLATGLVAAALACAATPQTGGGSVSDAAVVQPLMKELGVPGVSIAVIKDFKVAATYVYGVADVATGAPVTTRTLFQAASISKPVAAMASLKAV